MIVDSASEHDSVPEGFRGATVRRDIRGKRFGALVAISPMKSNGKQKNRIWWKCRCDCGKEKGIRQFSLMNGESASCGCTRMASARTTLINQKISKMVGLQFGWLTIVEFSGVKDGSGMLWRCRCKCGKFIFRTTKLLNRKDISKCPKSCGCAKRGVNHPLWEGGVFLSGSKWCMIKANAECRGLAVEIDLRFIESLLSDQGYTCKLSGVPLDRFTASLDRIDSSKGHLRDNVQWVHKDVNQMKMNLPEPDLLDWCSRIHLHRIRQNRAASDVSDGLFSTLEAAA